MAHLCSVPVCTTRPKIKPATTLDPVILPTKWGHGRRTGGSGNMIAGGF
jgi:hypothetical protein